MPEAGTQQLPVHGIEPDMDGVQRVVIGCTFRAGTLTLGQHRKVGGRIDRDELLGRLHRYSRCIGDVRMDGHPCFDFGPTVLGAQARERFGQQETAHAFLVTPRVERRVTIGPVVCAARNEKRFLDQSGQRMETRPENCDTLSHRCHVVVVREVESVLHEQHVEHRGRQSSCHSVIEQHATTASFFNAIDEVFQTMLFDLTSLRTLVTAVDLDGYGKAAESLHLSPSTVSLQLRALEERVGKPLFRKAGRRQQLTEAGEQLLSYARRMLALNDEAVLAVRGEALRGKVRLGVPQDFADSGLPRTLALFTSAHPQVQLDIDVGQSDSLLQLLGSGGLDLALTFGDNGGLPGEYIGTLAVHWFAHTEWPWRDGEQLPLLVLDPPCLFRRQAIDALDRAGISWRIALSGSSVSAVWAAARAGLGVVARTAIHVPDGVACIDGRFDLPDLQAVPLHLVRASQHGDSAAIDDLAGLLVNAVENDLVQDGAHGESTVAASDPG